LIWKLWFWPIEKIFYWKFLPKIARFFEEKNSKLSNFSHNLQKVAKNIEGGIMFLSLLSYLGCSQIWLNCFMDDCHFGYITNLSLKNILAAHSHSHLHFHCEIKYGTQIDSFCRPWIWPHPRPTHYTTLLQKLKQNELHNPPPFNKKTEEGMISIDN
jgi:hypothetical protein